MSYGVTFSCQLQLILVIKKIQRENLQQKRSSKSARRQKQRTKQKKRKTAGNNRGTQEEHKSGSRFGEDMQKVYSFSVLEVHSSQAPAVIQNMTSSMALHELS